MAKLYFRYGAMNSGKSTALLQAAYNYEERGQRVVLAKPGVDTKVSDRVASRLGMSRPVDVLIGEDDDLRERFAEHRRLLHDATDADTGADAGAAAVAAEPGAGAERSTDDVACLLVDEAQFLTAAQVDDLLRIAVLDDIPVLAYGIRTDFRTDAFPGSRRLLAIAHSIEELKTICRCGRKAIFNARLADGRIVFEGDQVAIDGVEAAYQTLCAECYLAESGGRLSD